MAGSNNITFRAGIGVLDYGVNTGFIIETADQANSPYIQMATHSGTNPYTANSSAGTLSVAAKLRIGNLNGSYGFVTDTFGFGAGQYGSGSGQSWVIVDATNGVRLGNDTTTRIQLNPNGSGFLANSNISWDTSGNLTVLGNASIAGWTINSTYINSGTTYIASGFNAPASGAFSWFGKSALGYAGVWLSDSSNRQISMINDGSTYPYLAVYDGTRYRVLVGGLNYAFGTDGATASVGMKIWDSAGNKLVEFSSIQNVIAGWTISPTSLSKNEVVIASGVDINNVTAVGEGWFGKSASGSYGMFLKGTSAPYLTIGAGNSTVGTSGRPYLGFTDGTRYRIVLGELNTVAWDGVATNSMGMKIWDSAGNKIVEFSSVQNMIAGWNVSSTYFGYDTGTNATSSGMSPSDYPFFAGSTYANRATAPFRVTPAGILNATGAVISGNITATTGSIAGWTLNSSYINSGNTYVASGFNIPTSGTFSWFGKSAAGYTGWFLNDTSGKFISSLAGNGTLLPYISIHDGTYYRVVLGGLNNVWNTGDTSINDMGMKIWNAAGQKIVEFSSSNNIISSWGIATNYMQSGTTYIASNFDIPAGQVAWFGKQASNSHQGVWLRDTTGAQIMMAIGGGSSARFAAGDVSIWRVAIGDMTPAYGSDGASTGYGMKIWNSAGSRLVEFSNTRNNIAGWSITPTAISSGSVVLASNEDYVGSTVSNAWFGKGLSGYYGWILNSASAGTPTGMLAALANAGGGLRPYMYLHDGTNYRIVIGELNQVWNTGDAASNSLGIKMWNAAGTRVFEMSSIRMHIGAWNFDTASFTYDTGTNSTSAGMAPADYPFYAGATYANRATATFRVTPAGLMTANNAAISGTVSAASGVVTLDSSGISITQGTSTQNALKWVSGATKVGDIHTEYSGGSSSILINSISDVSTAFALTDAYATNSSGSYTRMHLVNHGSASFNAGYASVHTSGNNFWGLAIGLSAAQQINSSFTSLQVGTGAILMSDTTTTAGMYLTANAYYHTSAVWKYLTSTYASYYYQQTGTHNFLVAASGTAGNTISWNTALTIKNTGFLQFNQYAAGNLSTDASGNVTSSSDERMKNITGKFKNSLEALSSIRPIRFYWKADTGLDITTEYVGFSAQNIMTSIPEAIGMDSRGMYSLQERPILATVVNAINELNDLRLKDRSELETMIIDLRDEISALRTSA
jgi:hypothetical protein